MPPPHPRQGLTDQALQLHKELSTDRRLYPSLFLNALKKSMLNKSGHLCVSYSKTQTRKHLTFYNKKVGGKERDFMTRDFFSLKMNITLVNISKNFQLTGVIS